MFVFMLAYSSSKKKQERIISVNCFEVPTAVFGYYLNFPDP